jgi:hypothetical protein
MEKALGKIAPWIPLLIAAGYFLFLVATWTRFTTNLKAADERFDEMLKKLEANGKPE